MSTADLGPSWEDDESDAAWRAANDAADRLEAAWGRVCSPQGSVEFLRFVPKPNEPHRLAIVEELVKTDLEQRWRRGQPFRVEYYLMRVPELGHDPAQLARVLIEEYRIRHDHGDCPNIGEYSERFPALAATLEPMLRAIPVSNQVRPARAVQGPPAETLPGVRPSESE